MAAAERCHVNVLRKLLLAVPAAAVVLSAPASNALAAPTTLLNDTFNTENGGAGQGVYSSFANFVAADVDLLGPGYFFNLCQSAGNNTLCVDMEGNGNGTLTTRTAFTFAPGPVSLRFDLAGSQRGNLDKTVTASLVSTLGATLFSEAFTLPSNAPFATFTRTFNLAAAVDAQLRFVSSGVADSFGLLLDNVVLTAGAADPGTGTGPTPVPEPATLALLGIGVLGVGAARRRLRDA